MEVGYPAVKLIDYIKVPKTFLYDDHVHTDISYQLMQFL